MLPGVNPVVTPLPPPCFCNQINHWILLGVCNACLRNIGKAIPPGAPLPQNENSGIETNVVNYNWCPPPNKLSAPSSGSTTHYD